MRSFQIHSIKFLLALSIVLAGCSQNKVSNEPVQPITETSPFEKEILAFEAEDSSHGEYDNPILFVGSSSIRFWETLEEDFPNHSVLNRGFGGSQMSDVLELFDRVVTPYTPSKIFIYEGDNDVNTGKDANEVTSQFNEFVQKVDQELPGTPIAFISIKPSPSRWELSSEMVKANTLIKEICDSRDDLEFIDVYNPMIGDNGKPKSELFFKDSLHMIEPGYVLWKDLVMPYMPEVMAQQE